MMKKGRYFKKRGIGGGGVKAKKMVTTGCVEGWIYKRDQSIF